MIVLDFAACRSTAPAYRLAITADGAVSYDGERNVTSLGHHQSQVEPKVVRDLLARLKASALATNERRQFTCDPSVRRCSMHPCSASFRFVLEGKTHEVTWTSDAPPDTPRALHEAVTDFEREVNSAQWVSPGP